MKIMEGKTLFLTLLAAAIVAALLGIAQIWFNMLAWDDFMRALITIAVVGALTGFLMAVDYDLPASSQKLLLGAIIILALIGGGMIIGQIWWGLLEWVTFAKIFGTILIVFALLSFYAAVKEDFGTNKKLRDENYLD